MDLSSLLASFASAFDQSQRLLTLQLGDGHIASQQLLPQQLEDEEGVSQGYRYQLTCLSPDVSIELKTYLACRYASASSVPTGWRRCAAVW